MYEIWCNIWNASLKSPFWLKLNVCWLCFEIYRGCEQYFESSNSISKYYDVFDVTFPTLLQWLQWHDWVVFVDWNRSLGLSEVSVLLRSQLSQSTEANEALRDDLRKLTADWSKAVEEVVQKEIDWQKEKEVRTGLICIVVCMFWFWFLWIKGYTYTYTDIYLYSYSYLYWYIVILIYTYKYINIK